MSRYCLDTSAYSNFKRGDQAAVDLIDRAAWIGISSVVIGELWTGFLLGSQLKKNESELNGFLAEPVVEELVVDREVGRIYAEMTTSLRRAGTPLPTNDIWIAAGALRAGAVVLTYDPHFEAIQGVESLVLS